MDIALCVVSYHSMGDLKKFVESYRDLYFDNPSFDVCLDICLVDASTDEIILSRTMLEEIFSDCFQEKFLNQVRVSATSDNVGYNLACNAVSSYIGTSQPSDSAPVLGFFNADTILTPNCLESCYHLFINPEIAVVGPKQIDSANRITHAGIFGANEAPMHRFWKHQDQGQVNDIREAVTVAGSAYLMRTSVYWEMANCPIYQSTFVDADGCWIEGAWGTFKHYYGDTYLSYHVREHGYKVMYNGSVGMMHEWHQASPQGGFGEQFLNADRELFRKACRLHNIKHD